jgi:hypothetical protein
MKCDVGYEVSRTAAGRTRSVVFVKRAAAKKFKAANPGSELRVVEVCFETGKVTRRGKRRF